MNKTTVRYDYGFESISEIEIDSLDFSYNAENYSRLAFREHKTSYYQIIWFQDENPEYYVNGRRLVLKQGSLLCINQDVSRRFSLGNTKGIVILFSENCFSRSKEDVRALHYCMLFRSMFSVVEGRSIDFFQRLNSLVSLIKEISRKKTDLHAEYSRILLQSMVWLIEREGIISSRRFPFDSSFSLLLGFRRLLSEHYNSERTVDFYASQLGLSRKSLNRITQKFAGKNAKEMINEKTFIEIKRLLLHSSLSLKEIASELKMKPVYVVKFFYKYEKTTPVQFRRKNEEKTIRSSSHPPLQQALLVDPSLS